MTQLEDLGRRIARLEKVLGTQNRASRLGSASLDNTSLTVNGPDGGLRGIIGQQADGTTALNIVNGGPPPAPSTPVVAPALGGIAVAWDGAFAGGAVIPLDWSRVEVHASPTDGFTPSAATLKVTIETPQGSTVYLAAAAPQYVVLLARNTSGAASAPTAQVGPYAPRAVVDTDVADGSITETKIADDAISTPKLKAGSIQTATLAALAVTTAKLAAGSVDATALSATAITGKTITGGTVTGSTIQTGTTGARITLNAASDGSIKVYDNSGTLLTSIGGPNAALSQIAGAMKTSLVNGGIIWDDLSSPGQAPGITSDGSSQLTIASGFAGGGGGNLVLNSKFAQGDSTLTYDALPSLTLSESTGVYRANLRISGAIVRTDLTGNSQEAWQIPVAAQYNTNWGPGVGGFNGSTNWAVFQYMRNAEDEVVLIGAFKAGATVPGTTVIQLPVGFRPKAQFPVWVQRANGSTVSGGYAAVTAGGNLNVLTNMGLGVAANNEYLINARFPLGNIG